MTVLKHFEKMGARIKFREFERRNVNIDIIRGAERSGVRIDIRRDKDGEYFDILSSGDLDLTVLDVNKKVRHLLLMSREGEDKHKFLCGHDERHWFVAAVPGRSVKNISDAMEALKPGAVIQRERMTKVSKKEKNNRHNRARKRQGEWFFVPIWHRLKVDSMVILKKEPIQRGAGKPHICEFVYREGGDAVWVSREHPNGLLDREYRKLVKKDPSIRKRLGWQRMVRDAKVYAKGKVSHSDHATLDLGNEWHEVFMNRENEAPGTRNVAFLD